MWLSSPHGYLRHFTIKSLTLLGLLLLLPLLVFAKKTQRPASMAIQRTILIIILTLTVSITTQSSPDSFTSLQISQTGLNFVKDLLISKAVSSITPLELPRIQKTLKIPILGNVQMVLSNVTIHSFGVGSSFVKPGDSGIAIVASETTCRLGMDWHYSYASWIFPILVSDQGNASITVEGMEVGLTLGLEIQEGKLKLSLVDCGCFVEDISINLDGGASWIYQGMIDAFEEEIVSALENAITKKLKEGVLKLDSLLQDLPDEIPVDDYASLNVTLVNQPLLTNSSIGLEIDGLFSPRKVASVPKYSKKDSRSSLLSFKNPSKMLEISLDEDVFNSASALYFNADFMQWIVDKIPDQSLLNTAGWRFIIPQLYKKYPNDDMNLNISLSSVPVIVISERNVGSTVNADLIIDVLKAGEIIPVACISLVIRGSGLAKISGNNLAGSVKLEDFSMSLKWSHIGNLRLYLIQPVIWTVVQTAFLPYANSILGKGFPLPIVHGFTLENAQLMYSKSRITVQSDVNYTE